MKTILKVKSKDKDIYDSEKKFFSGIFFFFQFNNIKKKEIINFKIIYINIILNFNYKF